tara:strand:- start:109476 stop:109925 length:450 start_codon:yes stop_codon:yes gene_type:complete
MNLKHAKDCERTNMEKILSFKLPNYWKKIGWGIFLLSFSVLIATKFLDGDFQILKDALKRVLLVALFIVALSREKVEDERIQQMRAKAFSVTFLMTAAYILLQPIVNFIVDTILNSEQQNVFEELGDFVILWFMLMVYLMFFHIAKKNS